MKMKKWMIIVVLVGLLGWAVYDFVISDSSTQTNTNANDTAIGFKKGERAPDFELNTFDGETVKLSDFRGEKVIVNFWATWCPPCRAEMPDMQKFHEDYDATILAVNLTSTEQSKKTIDEFLEEYGITFTVLSDEDDVVSSLYKASALPTSYLIDTNGNIYNVAIGALNYEMMVEVFEEMN